MKKLIPNLKERPLFFQLFFLFVLIVIGLLLATSLGGIASVMIGGIEGLGSVQKQDYSDPMTIWIIKVFQIFSQHGIFVFPSFLFAYFYSDDFKKFLRIHIFPNLGMGIIAVVSIVLMIPFIGVLVEINEQMQLPSFLSGLEEWMRAKEADAKILTEVFLNVDTIAGLLTNLLMIGLLAGLGEELLFRGVLQKVLFSKTNQAHLSIWITAIIFSAIHMQFFGFLPRMILGALFGYVYYWSKNLWIPILMHTVFNSTTIIAAYLAQKGIIEISFEEVGNFENQGIIWGSFVLGFIGFWWIYKKMN